MLIAVAIYYCTFLRNEKVKLGHFFVTFVFQCSASRGMRVPDGDSARYFLAVAKC